MAQITIEKSFELGGGQGRRVLRPGPEHGLAAQEELQLVVDESGLSLGAGLFQLDSQPVLIMT